MNIIGMIMLSSLVALIEVGPSVSVLALDRPGKQDEVIRDSGERSLDDRRELDLSADDFRDDEKKKWPSKDR